MLGTPDYIAPEQSVDARKADIRADIYSLGCTLYYLLTGGPPFTGTSLYDILQAHHSRDAMPLNLTRPEVPVELAALVAKMMAKEPKRRFQEPTEVSKALTPFFKKGNVAPVGSRPSLSQQAEQRPKRATPELRSVSIQTSSDQAPVTLAGDSAGTPGPEPMWASLMELRDIASSSHPRAPASDARRHRSAWFWPVAIAAAAFTSLLFGIITKITIEKNRVTVDVRRNAAPEKNADGIGRSPAGVPRDNNALLVNEASVASADAAVPRFASLFNGRDLEGWKTHPSQKGNWRVDGGILVGSGADVSHLYSERGDYRDFHLRLEARYNTGCDASLFFCSTEAPIVPKATPRQPKGYEVPISSRHQLVAGGILTAPGKAVCSSWFNPSVPPEQWFSLDLIVEGECFEVLLNGKLSAYYIEKQRLFSSGHFALQHSSPESVIEVRKIEIQEFKSTPRQDARELAILFGHTGEVSRVCFSPDGKRLLSSGEYLEVQRQNGGVWVGKEDCTVRLWDVATGQSLFTSPPQKWGINSLAFSSDGHYAASWSGWGDGKNPQDVSVWDLAVGRRIHELTHAVKADGYHGAARALAFSPDNRRVLAAFANPSIYRWDLEAEEELPILRLKAGDLLLAGAVFTSDRKRLITGSLTGPVELWDIESGKRLKAFVGHTGNARTVARSADDRLILSFAADETLRCWDAATGNQLRIIDLKGEGVLCVSMSPDGHKALTAGNYGTIRLWDLDTGKEVCRLNGHRMGVNCVAFSPDGRLAASGSDDKTVRIWKLP